MFHSMRTTIALGLVFCVLLTSKASCQQQPSPPNSPTNAAPSSNVVPSSLSSSLAAPATGTVPPVTDTNTITDKPQNVQQWPMVNVDGQVNKSTVDVHVPVFFDMVNHNDKESGKSKLDLSVLQGLVTVNKDKARNQNGEMTGPLTVTVFGIPVYTSKGMGAAGSSSAAASAASAPSSRSEQDNSIETKRASAAASVQEVGSTLTSQVQRVNEKMLGSLSDIMERFSKSLRRAGGNTEQRPAPVTVVQSRAPKEATKLIDEKGEDRRSALESRAA